MVGLEQRQGQVSRSELTPLGFLTRSAYVFPDQTAVVHEDRRYTYRQFRERVARLASRLRAAGLATGDRVAFLAPNIPALLEGHFGVPAAGGVLVPINTRLGPQEVGYILRHSGAKILFVDAELAQLAASAVPAQGPEIVRIDDTGAPGDPYEDFLAAGSPDAPPILPADEEELIAINYTSGTTGTPKGAMYTHRGAYLNALGVATALDMTSRSAYLWTLPMFHCDGWCFPWGVTAVGGTHVCLRKIDPDRIWDLIEAERVTHYCAAPTVQIGLVNSAKAHRLDWEVTTALGGAPPSPTLLGQFDGLNVRPIHLYGLTETYGPTAICAWQEGWEDLPVEDRARKLARQGQGHITSQLARVVDEDMRDVPRDGQTLGEIVTRGNTVTRGYLDDEEATAKAFAGGWYHTGDVAAWHPDGYVEIRDRSKDVIISGGENISSIEVEQTVEQHPAVLESAVVAIPDEKWGERPKAFVALRPGRTASEEELIEFCKSRLARYKAPAAIEFLAELPKTSTGKVQKFVLRDKEWAGHDRRVG